MFTLQLWINRRDFWIHPFFISDSLGSSSVRSRSGELHTQQRRGEEECVGGKKRGGDAGKLFCYIFLLLNFSWIHVLFSFVRNKLKFWFSFFLSFFFTKQLQTKHRKDLNQHYCQHFNVTLIQALLCLTKLLITGWWSIELSWGFFKIIFVLQWNDLWFFLHFSFSVKFNLYNSDIKLLARGPLLAHEPPMSCLDK